MALASTFKVPIIFHLLKGHLDYSFSRPVSSSPSPTAAKILILSLFLIQWNICDTRKKKNKNLKVVHFSQGLDVYKCLGIYIYWLLLKCLKLSIFILHMEYRPRHTRNNASLILKIFQIQFLLIGWNTQFSVAIILGFHGGLSNFQDHIQW